MLRNICKANIVSCELVNNALIKALYYVFKTNNVFYSKDTFLWR